MSPLLPNDLLLVNRVNRYERLVVLKHAVHEDYAAASKQWKSRRFINRLFREVFSSNKSRFAMACLYQRASWFQFGCLVPTSTRSVFTTQIKFVQHNVLQIANGNGNVQNKGELVGIQVLILSKAGDSCGRTPGWLERSEERWRHQSMFT